MRSAPFNIKFDGANVPDFSIDDLLRAQELRPHYQSLGKKREMIEDSDLNVSFMKWIPLGIFGYLIQSFLDFFDKSKRNRRAGLKII
jgi:hypothetical protein